MIEDDLPDPALLLTARTISDPREIAASIVRASAPYRPQLPDPAQKEARTQIAWRLVRSAAKIQGWLEDDQSILELDEQWDVAPSGPRAIPMRSVQGLELEVSLPDEPDEAYAALPELSPRPEDDLPRALLRMPLLPHALPESVVPRWTRTIVALSTKIRFDEEPVEALREVLGTCVGGVKASWPTRDEIVEFESSLIDTTTTSLVEGTRKVTRNLLVDLGLSVRECKIVEALALNRANDITNADINQKRAIMELRMDDLASRARNTPGEMRTELMTLKALSVVQGIAKADIEDDNEVFARVVSRGAKVRDVQATVTQTGPHKALGP